MLQETFFVHNFSQPTMPFSNLFKNCGYYFTAAVVIGMSICHPDFTAPSFTQVSRGCCDGAVCRINEVLEKVQYSRVPGLTSRSVQFS